MVHLHTVTVSFRNVSSLLAGGANVLQQNAVSFGLTLMSLTPLIYAHLQTWPSVIVPTVLTPIFNFDVVLHTLNMPVMRSQYPDAVCVWT